MFNLCCFPHCSRSTVWKGSAFSQQSQKVITMCNLMDFVFLIRICTCTKFLSVHVLKLNHFLIQRDSFKCKIPSNYLKSLSLLCLLGTAHKMQNTDPNTRLFFAPSASIAMFPVRELLLRCRWDGLVTTVAQSTVGFNALHTSTCKMSMYYSPGFTKALLINPLNDFNTTECKMPKQYRPVYLIFLFRYHKHPRFLNVTNLSVLSSSLWSEHST